MPYDYLSEAERAKYREAVLRREPVEKPAPVAGCIAEFLVMFVIGAIGGLVMRVIFWL